jgi:hypothetical protein
MTEKGDRVFRRATSPRAPAINTFFGDHIDGGNP